MVHQTGTAYSAFERGSILGASLRKGRELAMRLFASVKARHGQALSACHQIICLHVPRVHQMHDLFTDSPPCSKYYSSSIAPQAKLTG